MTSQSKTTCFGVGIVTCSMGFNTLFLTKTTCFGIMEVYEGKCNFKYIIMAVKIKLIRNNIKSSSSYGKFFAKAVNQGDVGFDEIVAKACRKSCLDKGTITNVVMAIEDLLKEQLADGHTVVLDGIGRFRLRVESKGVDDPKKFKVKEHIIRIVCGFLPSGHRDSDGSIRYHFCDGVKTVWQTGCKP